MPAHNQPYFLDIAADDLVHHSAAWVVKEPNRSPVFVDCHAVADASLDRAWDLQVSVWDRDECGRWAQSEPLDAHGLLNDAHEAAFFAEKLAGDEGAFAKIPYNVFEEVVDEHDTNYLIALAIAIDELPERVTSDEISDRIRLNADQDIDERSGRTIREQDAQRESLDDLAAVYNEDFGERGDLVEAELER